MLVVCAVCVAIEVLEEIEMIKGIILLIICMIAWVWAFNNITTQVDHKIKEYIELSNENK